MDETGAYYTEWSKPERKTPIQCPFEDCLLTLNDFQKLLGDINWIRPHLKLTTADLKPLFDCLQRVPNSISKKKLTNETESALVKVNETKSVN